jgi:predicted ester cyclase
MSESTNSALVRRWLHEVWNERRDDTVHELMDPGSVGHLEGLATRGVDEFLRARSYLLDAFPDFRVTVDAIIADGDQVVVRWSATGTHRGQLLDVPPTGKAVAFHGHHVVRACERPDRRGLGCLEPGSPARRAAARRVNVHAGPARRAGATRRCRRDFAGAGGIRTRHVANFIVPTGGASTSRQRAFP